MNLIPASAYAYLKGPAAWLMGFVAPAMYLFAKHFGHRRRGRILQARNRHMQKGERGASYQTLLRRTKYNNRKARRAALRLGVQLVRVECKGPVCKYCKRETPTNLAHRWLRICRAFDYSRSCEPSCGLCGGTGKVQDVICEPCKGTGCDYEGC